MCSLSISCGNVASILELDEDLRQEYRIFTHAPAVCVSHLSSLMVLIIFVGRAFHTSEAAATRLLPLMLSVYPSSMYELSFSGIYHLSTIK